MSLFQNLKQKLTSTRAGLVGKIQKLMIGRKKIDEDLINEIEEILIGSDVSLKVTETLIEQLNAVVRREGYAEPDEVMTALKETLYRFIDSPGDSDQNWHANFMNPVVRPMVVLVAGVNGTGKTTTIGKLAHLFSKNNKKVLLAAADTFRAAAAEQLEIWARRANVEIVRTKSGADPAAIAYDSLVAAKARAIDVLIVDTAGRLHTKVNLMNEMAKIKRVLAKQMPDAPHEVLLVLDASTGQNGLNQAREFSQAVGVTGLVLTKLDGTAKGGAVFSIRDELNLPVRFIGLGEGLEDLAEFNAAEFVEALFQ